MAIRITPDLSDTEKLLEAILPIILVGGQRASFLCPAGAASFIVQRMRVMISRKRKALPATAFRIPRAIKRADTLRNEPQEVILRSVKPDASPRRIDEYY